MPKTEWRKDGWGRPGRDLYLGGLYVGGVMELHADGKFRGWFMSTDEGNEVGWYTSEAEAKVAVEAALVKALAE